MSNTVRLPVLETTAGMFEPTLHAAEGNRIELPHGRSEAGVVAPSVTAGQLKLRYSGVRMGIKTRFGTSLG